MEDQPLPKAMAIIYVSENGRDDWRPVKPEDVPEWVKVPERMNRMLNNGEMICDPTIGTQGSDWWRAERIDSTGSTKQ